MCGEALNSGVSWHSGHVKVGGTHRENESHNSVRIVAENLGLRLFMADELGRRVLADADAAVDGTDLTGLSHRGLCMSGGLLKP